MKKISKCQQSKANAKRGFTLLEILVAISLSLLIIGSLYGIYVTSYKSYRRNINKADLNQNVRIVLERLTRDLRQTNEITTTLPASEIKFQDGHDTTKIRYINYFRDVNNNLHSKTSYYTFPSDPFTWVPWNAVDGDGHPPLEQTESDVIKAEKITNLFFESNNIITIDITASNSENQVSAQTEVMGRNIQ